MNRTHQFRHSLAAGMFAVALGLGTPLLLAEQPASGGGTVSRAEYLRLKSEHDELKKEFAEMKSQLSAVSKMQGSILNPAPIASSGKEKASVGASIAALQAEVDSLKHQVKETVPGSTQFLIAGYGAAGFTAQHGHDSFFTASFNPIFLWKISDRLLFEGELELELEGGETSTKLEMAQASYILNDYMTIGVGKFLNPTNYFVERQHMAWVNKLPDKPLAVYDGLTPETLVGAQIRGAIPIGSTVLEYSLFAANAPHLITEGDPTTVGMFDYDNFDNTDGHIAFGGHVGFLPIPQIEIGYGIEHSTVGPRNQSVNMNIQSVDLNVVDDSDMLKGVVNLRAQWIWSSVGAFTYDADGSQGFGPLDYNNKRDGGYVQLSYRPSHVDHFCKDLEPVVRFDYLNQSDAPEGYKEHRWTAGLNYWLTPSTVLKLAYEWDKKGNGLTSENAFMLQVATGF
jgi:hypothetical protein